MADITNLSNFLGDIANAIRAKKETTDPILAENFDAEIATIETGIGTEDATATANDILNPKTAYVNNEKITGNIFPSYGNTILIPSDINITNSVAVRTQNQLFQDINYELGLAARFDTSSGLVLYILKDNTFNTTDIVSFNATALGISTSLGSGIVRFIPYTVEDGYLHMIITCTPPVGATAYYSAYMYKYNLSDFTITKIGALSNFLTYSLSTEHTGKAQYHEALEFKDNNTFVMAVTDASGVGYGDKSWYLNYGIVSFDAATGTMAKVKSARPWIATVSRGDDWDGSYPRKICSYVSGEYLVYTAIKNYRGGTQANLYYASVFLNLNTYTCTYKIESSAIGYCLCGDKVYGNGKIYYANNLSTVIGTTSLTLNAAYPHLVTGNYLLAGNSSGSTLYTINDLTVSDDTVFSGYPYVLADYTNNYCFVRTNTTLNLLKSERDMVSFSRLGVNYFNTSDIHTTSDKVLVKNDVYVDTGKISGTMPNNGTLSYTPTTENQTIPLGYTDGGTVIGDANLLPENIKEDIKIFGVRGTATVLDTYDATATSADILAPKVAYANGEKVVGSIETILKGEGFVEDITVTKSIDWHDISTKARLALYFNGSGLRIGFINDGTVTDLKTFSASVLGTGTIATGRAIFFNELQSDTSIRVLVVSSTSHTSTANFYAGIYELDFSNLDDLQIKLVSTRKQVMYYTGDNQLCRPWGQRLVWLDNNTCMFGSTLCPGGGYSYTNMYFKRVNIEINDVEITTSNAKNVWLTSNIYADAWGTRLSGIDSMFVAGDYIVSVISKAYRGGNVNNYYYVTIFTNIKTNSDYFKLETSDIGYVIKDGVVYGNNNVYNVTALSTSLATISLSFPATYNKAVVGENYFMVVNGNLCIYKFDGYTPILQSSYTSYKHAQLSSDTVWAISTGTNILTFKVEQSVYAMIRNGATYNITTDATATAEDVVEGKTAYVNGEKITGTLPEVSQIGGNTIGNISVSEANVSILETNTQDSIVRNGAAITVTTSNANMAGAIGLTSDKLVKGNTILGIAGTYRNNVKQYTSVEEMNADTDVQFDDMAIILTSTINKTTANSVMKTIRAVKDITLTEAVTDTYTIVVGDNPQSTDTNFIVTVTPTECTFVHEASNVMVYRWTSEDGLTYTGALGSDQVWGELSLVYYGEWNDVFGEFIRTEDFVFTGLYKRSLDGWYKLPIGADGPITTEEYETAVDTAIEILGEGGTE